MLNPMYQTVVLTHDNECYAVYDDEGKTLINKGDRPVDRAMYKQVLNVISGDGYVPVRSDNTTYFVAPSLDNNAVERDNIPTLPLSPQT